MNFKTRREFLVDLAELPVKFDKSLHIDSDEAAQWTRLEPGDPLPFAAIVLGSNDASSPLLTKMDRLIERMMGEPTLDDMHALRESIRQMVIDRARDEVVAAGIALQRQAQPDFYPSNPREAMFVESLS